MRRVREHGGRGAQAHGRAGQRDGGGQNVEDGLESGGRHAAASLLTCKIPQVPLIQCFSIEACPAIETTQRHGVAGERLHTKMNSGRGTPLTTRSRSSIVHSARH